MIKKIIHISDVHIPNDVQKRPYQQMLEKGVEQIKEVLKDYDKDEVRIVMVGDIFHHKIRISNEATSVFHHILNELNDVCKTYIVAGNHDLIESNKDRLDSISPTFDIKGSYNNIVFIDRVLDYKSGCIKDDNVYFALYSIFDNYRKPTIEDKQLGDRVVGLFHGNISGATTDKGHTLDEGVPYKDFDICDCVMAGHIHKYQELVKNNIKMVYPSSMLQQNYGENVSKHGFLLWDMETIDYEFIEVDNDYRFFNFKITSYDDIKENKERLINE